MKSIRNTAAAFLSGVLFLAFCPGTSEALDDQRVKRVSLQVKEAVENTRVALLEDENRELREEESLQHALQQMSQHLGRFGILAEQQREVEYRESFTTIHEWARTAQDTIKVHAFSPKIIERWNQTADWFNELSILLEGPNRLTRLIVIDADQEDELTRTVRIQTIRMADIRDASNLLHEATLDLFATANAHVAYHDLDRQRLLSSIHEMIERSNEFETFVTSRASGVDEARTAFIPVDRTAQDLTRHAERVFLTARTADALSRTQERVQVLRELLDHESSTITRRIHIDME